MNSTAIGPLLGAANDYHTTNQSITSVPRDQTDRLLETYYLVVRALASSANSNQADRGRRGLPRELICRICSFANYHLPSKALSQVSEEVMIVSARDAERTSIPWFRTAPFTRGVITDIVAMQLVTDSHDQGWTTVPGTSSYSWFGIRVIRSDDHNLTGSLTNQDREWESHSNRVASGDIHRNEGRLFDSNHEIWTRIGEGDYLEVTANAQYAGWQNYAERGVLQVFTRWQPSKAFLDLVCPPESPSVIRAPAVAFTAGGTAVPPQVQSQVSPVAPLQQSSQAAPPNSQSPHSAAPKPASMIKRVTTKINKLSRGLTRRIRGGL